MASSMSPWVANQALAVRCSAGDELGMLVLQALVQDVGEELVVAVPAAHIIQRIHEQVRVLEALQDFLAVGDLR